MDVRPERGKTMAESQYMTGKSTYKAARMRSRWTLNDDLISL